MIRRRGGGKRETNWRLCQARPIYWELSSRNSKNISNAANTLPLIESPAKDGAHRGNNSRQSIIRSEMMGCQLPASRRESRYPQQVSARVCILHCCEYTAPDTPCTRQMTGTLLLALIGPAHAVGERPRSGRKHEGTSHPDRTSLARCTQRRVLPKMNGGQRYIPLQTSLRLIEHADHIQRRLPAFERNFAGSVEFFSVDMCFELAQDNLLYSLATVYHSLKKHGRMRHLSLQDTRHRSTPLARNHPQPAGLWLLTSIRNQKSQP